MRGVGREVCSTGQTGRAVTRGAGARLAREIWKDRELAERLEKDAADLKRRFNRDFWVEDGEYFALALGPDGETTSARSGLCRARR